MTELATKLSSEDIFSKYNADESAARAAYERSQKASNFFTKSIFKSILEYRRIKLAASGAEL